MDSHRQPTPEPQRLLTPAEAAELLPEGITERTLRNWRSTRRGPPYVRLSQKHVGYRRQDLLRWLERQRVEHAGSAVVINLADHLVARQPVEQGKAEDPAALRARIAQLEALHLDRLDDE